jgi:hypothetical protein
MIRVFIFVTLPFLIGCVSFSYAKFSYLEMDKQYMERTIPSESKLTGKVNRNSTLTPFSALGDSILNGQATPYGLKNFTITDNTYWAKDISIEAELETSKGIKTQGKK